jgi:gamma-F420-2:alpha-L-glutamate ligase
MKLWVIANKRPSGKTKWETTRLLDEGALRGADAHLILHSTVDIIVSGNDRKSVRVKNRAVTLPDVVIPRTGSGTGYFGRAVLRHFERLGVPVLNTADSIEATKDKLYAHQIFAQAGIPTPKTMLVKHPVNPRTVESEIGFPAVVKILSGSYGKGVYLVHNTAEFVDFIEFAHGIKNDEAILVQEYVSLVPGADVRVIVIGGKTIGAMKRVSKDGSFKANITRGGVGEIYPLDDELTSIAEHTAKCLNLDIAGIDLLFGPGGYLVCEANSAPGFYGFEHATGINVAGAIMDLAYRSIAEKNS